MKQFFVKIYDVDDKEGVISGEFDTKKEALSYREELIRSGFDYVGAFERKGEGSQDE